MNINNLTKSFKYSSLLGNKNLKKYQQNFNKVNLDIDLYSIWDFNIKLIGLYIFLGLDNDNLLLFLDFIPKLNSGIVPLNAKLNKILINDFFSYKEKNLIRPFNFPIENEDCIFNYISSFFNYIFFWRKNMNINNLTKSFKYSSLLAYKDLKRYQENFNKINLDIDLYSVWDFNIAETANDVDLNNTQPQLGIYILLGNATKNYFIFLDFNCNYNGMAPIDAELKLIQIQDFFKYKKKNLIRLFNFPFEQEDVIFKYISSYFYRHELIEQWKIK